MFRFSPLLFIGLVLSLWARSMTAEDVILVGMGKNGHLELRSAAAALSVSASPGLHQLGRWFSFELISRKIADRDTHPHQGLLASFQAPFDWQVRLTMLSVMAAVIAGLIVLIKIYKPR